MVAHAINLKMERNPSENRSKTTSKNILEERFNFYRRCQKAQETLTHFIADVRRLARTCEFHLQEEEFLIRDRVLFGLKNKNVQSRIIEIGGNPSLEIAMISCSGLVGDGARAKRRRKGLLFFVLCFELRLKANECFLFLDEKQSKKGFEGPDVLSINENGNKGNSTGLSHMNIRLKSNSHDQNVPSATSEHKPTTSSMCSKTFKNSRQLKLYKKQFHHPSKPNHFQQKRFANSNQSNTYNPMKPEIFECYICKKRLESRVKLRFHIYHHSRAKKWLCTKCGMQFVAESQLKIHLMRDDHNVSTIENTKPFVCSICEKRFTQKNSLDTHMRVHSGEDHDIQLINPF